MFLHASIHILHQSYQHVIKFTHFFPTLLADGKACPIAFPNMTLLMSVVSIPFLPNCFNNMYLLTTAPSLTSTNASKVSCQPKKQIAKGRSYHTKGNSFNIGRIITPDNSIFYSFLLNIENFLHPLITS